MAIHRRVRLTLEIEFRLDNIVGDDLRAEYNRALVAAYERHPDLLRRLVVSEVVCSVKDGTLEMGEALEHLSPEGRDMEVYRAAIATLSAEAQEFFLGEIEPPEGVGAVFVDSEPIRFGDIEPFLDAVHLRVIGGDLEVLEE